MREAPSAVIASVAAGVGPTPFLAVYTVLFIAHGFFHPVEPPDITTTLGGERVAGVIAAALLLAMILTLVWFLNGRRRWPFVIGQLATLVTSVDFIVDSTTGSPAVPAVLALTSAAALICAFLPPSWDWVGARLPGSKKVSGLGARTLTPAPLKHVGRRRFGTSGRHSAVPDGDPPPNRKSDANA